MPEPEQKPKPAFLDRRRRMRFLGISLDDAIKAFFGGNALVSVAVLALITIFLFREGAAFFGQNRQNLEVYRKAGLEFVDVLRQQQDDHTALSRYLSDIRLQFFKHLTEVEGMDNAGAFEALEGFDDYAYEFGDAVEPLRDLVSELTDQAIAIKTQFQINEDRREQKRQLLAEGKREEAAAVDITPVNFVDGVEALISNIPAYRETNDAFSAALVRLAQATPVLPTPELQARMERFEKLISRYVSEFPGFAEQLEAWDYRKPVGFTESISAFVFGRDWVTASFWQDWYGIMPLLTGSVMVSMVALFFAIPMGVGAAIYVNQIATPTEAKYIKPSIEFIAAIPSVVLGFFGIAVLGGTLRALSQFEALAWVPGFPIAERLNVLTAGCLLALIAVPTIFTLAEDAINNVPRAFTEASFALGSTRLQTIIRIIIPASLSGIVSAVLLGLGRVIGETMVVLLVAGNRIDIPDFTQGLAVFTQPVHTMTGIIAQEMGEVVRGSIHYRALFCVGIVLFFLSLVINFFAQKIVRRYRISVG